MRSDYGRHVSARAITDAEKEAFWSDGVVCLRDMFDPAWISRMQAAVDDAVANPGPMSLQLGKGLEGTFHGDSFVWTWQDDSAPSSLRVRQPR